MSNTTQNTSFQDQKSNKKASDFSSYIPEALKQLSWSDFAALVTKTKSNVKKDTILGTSFQCVEINRKKKLFLTNTYTNGFQVFDVDDPNDAKEVISIIEDRPIKFVKFIPEPYLEKGKQDPLKDKRPLIAVVSCDDKKIPARVQLYSLKTKEYVHKFGFSSEVHQIACNARVLVVVLRDQIIWFDPLTMQKLVQFSCFPNLYSYDVVALGPRWIAYPGNSPVPVKSYEYAYPPPSSLAEMSMGMTKKAVSGIMYTVDLGVKSVSNYINPDSDKNKSQQKTERLPIDETHAGTIIIRDIVTRKVIAHFRSHWEPICALAFDPTGTLLVSASVQGTMLNVYQILPSATGEINASNFRHIYVLKRGVTSAIIRDIQFSINSKWVAVSSAHGTTHLFAINPDGSLPTVLSHSNSIPKLMTASTLQRNEQPEAKLYDETVNPKQKRPIVLSAVNRIHNRVSIFSGETNPKAVFHSTIAATFFTSGKQVTTEHLLISTSSGLMSSYELEPRESDKTETKEGELELKIELISKGDLSRVKQGEMKTYSLKELYAPKPQCKEKLEDITSRWISNIEIETYCPREIPLWMSGQFKFKTFENKLYPDMSDLQGIQTTDLAKSVYIRNAEPIPVTYFRNGKPVDSEPSAPVLNGIVFSCDFNSVEKIAKAMGTPMNIKSPNNDSEWLKINSDDILPNVEPTKLPLDGKRVISPEPLVIENEKLDVKKESVEDDSTDDYFKDDSPTIMPITPRSEYDYHERQETIPPQKEEKTKSLAESITADYFGKPSDEIKTDFAYRELRHEVMSEIMEATKKSKSENSEHFEYFGGSDDKRKSSDYFSGIPDVSSVLDVSKVVDTTKPEIPQPTSTHQNTVDFKKEINLDLKKLSEYKQPKEDSIKPPTEVTTEKDVINQQSLPETNQKHEIPVQENFEDVTANLKNIHIDHDFYSRSKVEDKPKEKPNLSNEEKKTVNDDEHNKEEEESTNSVNENQLLEKLNFTSSYHEGDRKDEEDSLSELSDEYEPAVKTL